MTRRNEIKEDIENFITLPEDKMELIIDYVIQKEKDALLLEKQIYMMLKTKYEI